MGAPLHSLHHKAHPKQGSMIEGASHLYRSLARAADETSVGPRGCEPVGSGDE